MWIIERLLCGKLAVGYHFNLVKMYLMNIQRVFVYRLFSKTFDYLFTIFYLKSNNFNWFFSQKCIFLFVIISFINPLYFWSSRLSNSLSEPSVIRKHLSRLGICGVIDGLVDVGITCTINFRRHHVVASEKTWEGNKTTKYQS